MRRSVLAVALIALFACKKDKADQASSGTATPPAAEAKSATAPAAEARSATAPAAARPATVSQAQSNVVDKFAVEAEAFGKDVEAAASDCAKAAAAVTAHAAALTAAQDAMLAAKIDDDDPAVKAWLAAGYSVRIAKAMTTYARAAAKCATDTAFVATAGSFKLSADAMAQAGVALDEANAAMGEAGKAMDQAGKAMGEAGKAMDQAGKAMGEAGKAVDKAKAAE
jgi:hypothetical protein